MDDERTSRARLRRGVVVREDLGGHPGRAARSERLLEVQPGAYVAETQPVDLDVLLAALKASSLHDNWVVLEHAALWLHGVARRPRQLVVGIGLGHDLAARPPILVRRVAASVLAGARTLRGVRVAALEVAVIQAAAVSPRDEIAAMVVELVRERRTTIARLRARCRRGFKGSASIRGVCDDLSGGSLDREVRLLRQALEARGVDGLETEVRFVNAHGGSAYADLLHRPTMTVFEVDGLVEHTRRQRFRADRRRDRWMRREHDALTLRIDVLEIREDVEGLADELVWFVEPREDRHTA